MSTPRLIGTLRPPGDKSVTHRALLLGAVADGTTRVTGALDAADTRSTAGLVTALGATLQWDGDLLTVRGIPAPRSCGPIDCGNAGTAARLVCGLLAGHPGSWTLTGDASLRRRPMRRVITPLQELGAELRCTADGTLPVVIEGRPLRGREVLLDVPSAQVKSALLLAGLVADGPLSVSQSRPTRDHTERMLPRFGIDCEVDPGRVTVSPGRPRAATLAVPGDPSAAAYPLVAALLAPGSRLRLTGVGLWPRRGGALLALQEAGAPIEVLALRDADGDPLGDLHVESGPLRPLHVRAADVPDLVDELPILALAAARAEGTSRFEGLAELRHKESDRLAAIVELLTDLDVQARVEGDGLTIEGRASLERAPSRLEHPDHRMAMTAAVAHWLVTGSWPDSLPAASVSWPGFLGALASVTAA